jgi:hypothetical protein
MQSEKLIPTIVWNLREFHLIKVLEKARKFNVGYYIAETLEPLSQWHSIEATRNERKLLAHADNVRSHTAKLSTQYFNENRMKSAPHLLYSPDLGPSEFCLFGYVKRCLAGLSELVKETRRLLRRKRAFSFLSHMDSSACHDGHKITDQLTVADIARAPHPPYSPDLSSCNFWFYGFLKESMKGMELPADDQSVEAITTIWRGVIFDTLQFMFQE